MKVLQESIFDGFIDNLFDMFKKPDLPSGSGVRVLEDQIDPHSVEDLYEGVLMRLRTAGRNKTVKERIMPAFFPAEGKESTIPKTINPKLVAKYGNMLEDVIVEYCTVDAIDILKRLKAQYEKTGKSLEDLTGDACFGIILQQIHKGDYDIIDKLVKVYKEFVSNAKKKEWQVEAPEDEEESGEEKGKKPKPAVKPSMITKPLLKEIQKRIKVKLSSEEIIELMSNETFMPVVATAVANAINKINVKDDK